MTKNHDGKMHLLAKVSTIVTIAIYFIVALANGRYISSDETFICTLVAMIFGVGVVLGVIEHKIMAPLKPFVIARIGWLSAIAAIAFFARASTIDDVNRIFHIDASALPMTVIVGTILKVFSWGRWVFTVGFFISLLIEFLIYTGRLLSDNAWPDEKYSAHIIAICAIISLGLCAFFSQFQFHDPVKFEQRLYRIAHMTDFSASFNCQGYDSNTLDALFIGPNQDQALFAPKLPENYFFIQGPTLLATVNIPSKFTIGKCLPEVIDVNEMPKP